MADKIYPKGAIALGNGNLLQVQSVRLRDTNNGKNVHTIARSPAGVFVGPLDTELSFDAVVDEDGYERDYLRAVKSGTITEIRIKVPGETITFRGIPTERSQEFAFDGEIKYSISLVGRSSASI